MLRAMYGGGLRVCGREYTRETRETQVWSLVCTRRRACAVPHSVLRSGPDDADRVDGVGGAVAVGARAGAVAVQVVAFALEMDEVAPAGVAADPTLDVAAHVAPAVDAAASPALRVLRAGGVVAGGAAHMNTGSTVATSISIPPKASFSALTDRK